MSTEPITSVNLIKFLLFQLYLPSNVDEQWCKQTNNSFLSMLSSTYVDFSQLSYLIKSISWMFTLLLHENRRENATLVFFHRRRRRRSSVSQQKEKNLFRIGLHVSSPSSSSSSEKEEEKKTSSWEVGCFDIVFVLLFRSRVFSELIIHRASESERRRTHLIRWLWFSRSSPRTNTSKTKRW